MASDDPMPDDLMPPVGLVLQPTSVRGRRTLDAVLDAAVRVFGKATDRRRPSVAAVAELVDISPAAVYQYFPDRQSLVLAAMERDCALLVRDALDHCEGHSCAIIGGRFLTESGHLAASHPLAVRAAFTEHRDVLALPLVRRQFDLVAARLAEELSRAQQVGMVRTDLPARGLADLMITGIVTNLWAEAIGGGRPTARYQALERLFRLSLFCPIGSGTIPADEDDLVPEMLRRIAAA